MRVNAVVNAPCKKNHEKRPGRTLTPPIILGVNAPGPSWQVISVWEIDLFPKQAKRVLYILYIGKLTPRVRG